MFGQLGLLTFVCFNALVNALPLTHHYGAATLNHLLLSRLELLPEQQSTQRAGSLAHLTRDEIIAALLFLIQEVPDGLANDLRANPTRRPAELSGRQNFKTLVSISATLAGSASGVRGLLGEALAVARGLPPDESWPVARRLLTAGLVLRRLRFGAFGQRVAVSDALTERLGTSWCGTHCCFGVCLCGGGRAILACASCQPCSGSWLLESAINHL